LIEEGLGFENREDWDHFMKDGEEEDLDFCRKNLGNSSTLDCIYWSKGHCVALH